MKVARIVVPSVALILVGGLFYWLVIREPLFISGRGSQCILCRRTTTGMHASRPLHQHGASVAPLVIRELPKKEMPRRRYAIRFLGEKRYVEALPTLEEIALDENEKFYFRADALLAIYDIVPSRAATLAQKVTTSFEDPADKFGHLKRVASDVERGQIDLYRRKCD